MKRLKKYALRTVTQICSDLYLLLECTAFYSGVFVNKLVNIFHLSASPGKGQGKGFSFRAELIIQTLQY